MALIPIKTRGETGNDTGAGQLPPAGSALNADVTHEQRDGRRGYSTCTKAAGTSVAL